MGHGHIHIVGRGFGSVCWQITDPCRVLVVTAKLSMRQLRRWVAGCASDLEKNCYKGDVMISSGQESCGTIEADLRYTGSYGGQSTGRLATRDGSANGRRTT